MSQYEPNELTKQKFLEEQINSMQITYYRNLLDMRKVSKLKDELKDEKYKLVYDQKLNEFKQQNDEIEIAIDLFQAELDEI